MTQTTLTAESEVIPLKKVAAMIGCNYNHATVMVRQGRFPLPVIRYGSRYLVARRAVEAFLRGEVSA